MTVLRLYLGPPQHCLPCSTTCSCISCCRMPSLLAFVLPQSRDYKSLMYDLKSTCLAPAGLRFGFRGESCSEVIFGFTVKDTGEKLGGEEAKLMYRRGIPHRSNQLMPPFCGLSIHACPRTPFVSCIFDRAPRLHGSGTWTQYLRPCRNTKGYWSFTVGTDRSLVQSQGFLSLRLFTHLWVFFSNLNSLKIKNCLPTLVSMFNITHSWDLDPLAHPQGSARRANRMHTVANAKHSTNTAHWTVSVEVPRFSTAPPPLFLPSPLLPPALLPLLCFLSAV